MRPQMNKGSQDLDASEEIDPQPARNNFLEGFKEDGEELPELKLAGKAKSRFGGTRLVIIS